MKQLRIFLLSAVAIFVLATFAKETRNLGRAVDLKASDGTILKASYFAAAKPGPAVLLYHQSNRTRKGWDMVARQLAAGGNQHVDRRCSQARRNRWTRKSR